MRYLTAEQVLFIHARVIKETGGAHGMLNIGLLQSAVARQATFGDRDLYPDIFSKAAVLMASLTRNHAFLDGNKRTAVTAAGIFLGMNGVRLEAGQRDLVQFALAVANGKMTDRKAAAWFRKRTATGTK